MKKKRLMRFYLITTVALAAFLTPAPVFAAGIQNITEVGSKPSPAPYDIAIEGSPQFSAQTKRALDFLAVCAPDDLKEADVYLESIQYADRSGMLVHSGIFQASDVTAFAPGYSQEVQVFWFAGTIVHDAHHAWQEAHGMDSDNWSALSESEREAIEADARDVQLRVLKQCLPAVSKAEQPNAEFMIQYLTSMQDDTGDCPYCEVEYEDRTW